VRSKSVKSIEISSLPGECPMASRSNRAGRLFLFRLSGEFAPHIFQPAVRRFVRSLDCEVIFPILGKTECHLIFRGAEASFRLFTNWLEQASCGLHHLETINVGEANNLVSALKGNVRYLS
jgi:hypothetical protein